MVLSITYSGRAKGEIVAFIQKSRTRKGERDTQKYQKSMGFIVVGEKKYGNDEAVDPF